MTSHMSAEQSGNSLPLSWQRLLALSGVAFAVLFLVGWFASGGDAPDYGASDQAWTNWADDNEWKSRIGAFAMLLAGFVFLHFAATIRTARALDRGRGAHRRGWVLHSVRRGSLGLGRGQSVRLRLLPWRRGAGGLVDRNECRSIPSFGSAARLGTRQSALHVCVCVRVGPNVARRGKTRRAARALTPRTASPG